MLGRVFPSPRGDVSHLDVWRLRAGMRHVTQVGDLVSQVARVTAESIGGGPVLIGGRAVIGWYVGLPLVGSLANRITACVWVVGRIAH